MTAKFSALVIKLSSKTHQTVTLPTYHPPAAQERKEFARRGKVHPSAFAFAHFPLPIRIEK